MTDKTETSKVVPYAEMVEDVGQAITDAVNAKFEKYHGTVDEDGEYSLPMFMAHLLNDISVKILSDGVNPELSERDQVGAVMETMTDWTSDSVSKNFGVLVKAVASRPEDAKAAIDKLAALHEAFEKSGITEVKH